MGSWFSRGERRSPTDRDYAAYESDLNEMKTFLTRVNRAESPTTGNQSTEDRDACQFAESEGYLETLQIKLKQLENMKLFIEKEKRGPNPAPQSLVATLGKVDAQCRQTINLLTQRRQQMQREQQQRASSDQQQHQSDDDDGAINDVVYNYIQYSAAADVTHPLNSAEDSNRRSPSPTLLPTEHDPQQQPVPPTDVRSWAEERSFQQQPRDACTKWEFNRHDDQYMLSVRDVYMKIKRRESHLDRMAAKYRELDRHVEITFTGEQDTDRGALRREFFSLTFERFISRDFKECKMFVGERGHLLPNDLTVDLVEAYNTVGMMIVHAARNGCNGFPGLSPAIAHYLARNRGRGPAFIEECCVPISVDDVDNHELRALLIKINSSEELTEADNSSLADWLEESDSRLFLRPESRQLIVQHLLIYYVFTKRIRQIEAIAEGMKILNFDLFLSENASDENIEFVFPSADGRVTPQMFLAIVVQIGTRHRRAWEFFQKFLDDLDSGRVESSVAQLIQFLHGSPHLPDEIRISYSGNKDVLPVAHACYSELRLPIGNDTYDQFRDNMLLGLAETQGRFDMN